MMYRCLHIIEIGSHEGDFTYAGVDNLGMIVQEKLDGHLTVSETTKGMALQSTTHLGTHTDIEDDEIEMSMYITDCRIAFLCKEYERGGGWVGWGGGLVVAVVANAVSKSNAKKRTLGKTMTGHIRYEWLIDVGFERKTSFMTDNCINLNYRDTDNIDWTLALNFPKNVNTEELANNIVQKAARYKIAMNTPKSADELKLLHYYAKGGRIAVPDPKAWSWSETFGAFQAPDGEGARPNRNALEAPLTQLTSSSKPKSVSTAPVPDLTVPQAQNIAAHNRPQEQQPQPVKQGQTSTPVIRFCPKCGQDIQTLPVRPKFCPKCGTGVGGQ